MIGPDGREYPMEVVDQAEELYCLDGLTYDQVSERMDVAASTLKRWGGSYDWSRKREEIRQARSSIKGNTILLRSKLIENCLISLDPMDAFAVAKLEDLALKARTLAGQEGRATEPVKLKDIRTPEDAAEALEEAVTIKLGRMLADPAAFDFGTIKNLKQALEMIGSMKAKDEGKGTKQPLTPESAERFRREILGIK